MVFCRPHVTKARLAWVASYHLLPLTGVRNTLLAEEHFKKKWATIMESLLNTGILFHPASEGFEDPLTKLLEIILNWLWRVSWVLHPKYDCYCWSKSAGTMVWLCSLNSMHVHFLLPQFFPTCPISTTLLREQWESPWCLTETEVPGNTGVRQRAHIHQKLPSLSSANIFQIRTANWHLKQTLWLTIFIQTEESPEREKKIKAKN